MTDEAQSHTPRSSLWSSRRRGLRTHDVGRVHSSSCVDPMTLSPSSLSAGGLSNDIATLNSPRPTRGRPIRGGEAPGEGKDGGGKNWWHHIIRKLMVEKSVIRIHFLRKSEQHYSGHRSTPIHDIIMLCNTIHLTSQEKWAGK